MTILPSSIARARQVVGILDHISSEAKTYTIVRNKYEIQFGVRPLSIQTPFSRQLISQGGCVLYDQAGNVVMRAVKSMMAGISELLPSSQRFQI
jgi:hypothetical protein